MERIVPDHEYIVKIRRELHQYPEIGFDLPKTLAIIKRELDAMGIPYTDKYGKSSLVGTIAKGRGKKVIALRADMDALPIHEETDVPFRSLHDGAMHACGHDTHMAMLLGTAKMLKATEDELPCEVRLFFQAAEEYAPGGAKLMCEDGVMDGVDAIIGAHINSAAALGTIGTNYSVVAASSHGFYIDLYGKSAHVSTPQLGVDAIAMAVRVFSDIQMMRARELDPKQPVVIGIGEFHGGSANNIVCEHVRMHGTIRTLSNELDEHIYRRITEIAESVARDMGGRCEVTTSKHYPSVVNDPEIAAVLVEAAKDAIGEENCDDKRGYMMGAEDFAFYLLRGKGAFFHVGMKSDKYVMHSEHNSRFFVDEDALSTGPKVFYEFVMKYGNM